MKVTVNSILIDSMESRRSDITSQSKEDIGGSYKIINGTEYTIEGQYDLSLTVLKTDGKVFKMRASYFLEALVEVAGAVKCKLLDLSMHGHDFLLPEEFEVVRVHDYEEENWATMVIKLNEEEL